MHFLQSPRWKFRHLKPLHMFYDSGLSSARLTDPLLPRTAVWPMDTSPSAARLSDLPVPDNSSQANTCTQDLWQWTVCCKTVRPTGTRQQQPGSYTQDLWRCPVCCKTVRPTGTRQQQPGSYTQDLWRCPVCCKTVRPTGTRKQQPGSYTQDLWQWTVCCKSVWPTGTRQQQPGSYVYTGPLTVDRLLQGSPTYRYQTTAARPQTHVQLCSHQWCYCLNDGGRKRQCRPRISVHVKDIIRLRKAQTWSMVT